MSYRNEGGLSPAFAIGRRCDRSPGNVWQNACLLGTPGRISRPVLWYGHVEIVTACDAVGAIIAKAARQIPRRSTCSGGKQRTARLRGAAGLRTRIRKSCIDKYWPSGEAYLAAAARAIRSFDGTFPIRIISQSERPVLGHVQAEAFR